MVINGLSRETTPIIEAYIGILGNIVSVMEISDIRLIMQEFKGLKAICGLMRRCIEEEDR